LNFRVPHASRFSGRTGFQPVGFSLCKDNTHRLEACATKAPAGVWARFWGWVEFSGAALFTRFVKGAGFSFMRNSPRAKKRQTGIGQRETENRGSENPHP
jgi:hypothetical protein